MADLHNIEPPETETASKQAEDPHTSGEAKVFRIYDPAMCCSSGVCGPGIDPVLAGFAGTLQFLTRQATVKIERYNLGQQPQAFVDNSQVKFLLADGGIQRLPYIFIDGEIVFQARYPSRDELAQALGIPLETLSPPSLAVAPGELCCGEGGVGKTSMPCVAALGLAERGDRVLLISTDPASPSEENHGQTNISRTQG